MVSAIIPARNEEASIARTVESVAAQPEIAEVIVVNDQSTDRTGEILARLAARLPKVRVLTTGELPRGWVGKNYAASLGAAAAAGDWLLFTDADTFHLPGAARHALNDAADHDAALVSYSPEQELRTFWERALIPFVYCRLAVRFSFGRVNDSRLPDAAANGQFMLVRRDVYESVGGHAAVANEIVEDVALARRIKREGHRIYFAAPGGTVRARMYASLGTMWQGWTKNLYPLMGGRPGAALLELDAFPLPEIVALALVWALLFRAERAPAWMFPAVLLGALAGAHLRYAAALRRNLFRVSLVQYYVPGACLYAAALVASWWKNTRGAVAWKGREYPAKGPANGL